MFSITFFFPPRLAVLLTGLALAAFAAAPAAHAQPAAGDDGGPTPDAVVHVSGMACTMCARSMTNALEKLDAVDKADVQLDDQKALLTLKTHHTVAEETLREAVEGAGYEFRRVVFADEKADSSGGTSDPK